MRYVTLPIYDPPLSPQGLEWLYSRGDASGVSAHHVKRLRAVLAALETASLPSDMALPGLRLHRSYRPMVGVGLRQLARDLRIRGSAVTNVDLVDYH